MRVVRNLTENAAIANADDMVNCMRMIKDLSEKTSACNGNVYQYLKEHTDIKSNNQLGLQLQEEKEKAERILEDQSWEDKLKQAENFAFFNGTVRFLYRNEEDECNWNEKKFNAKFNNAKCLFSNDNNKVSVNTVKQLLKQFCNFDAIKEKYLFTTIGYHNRDKCWKKDILCGTDIIIRKAVQALLSGDQKKVNDNEYSTFLESGWVEKITEKSDSHKYRYHRHGSYY